MYVLNSEVVRKYVAKWQILRTDGLGLCAPLSLYIEERERAETPLAFTACLMLQFFTGRSYAFRD